MKIVDHALMRDYTTIGIGGAVPRLYLPENEQELCELLAGLAASGAGFRPIGNGSNLIVDDRGLPDVIVCTRNMKRSMEQENERITVDAGYPVAQLSYQTAGKSLSGLEFAVGIPGSIGGVVRMNAGAHKHSASEVVESVRLVLPGGKLQTWSNQDLKFGYRKSAIPPDAIVSSVTLRLLPGDSRQIHDLVRSNNEKRTSTQPLREKSAGCIFRNPGEDCSAGRHIEESGLKGARIGGAVVSEIHANFIVNRENASFDDVIRLIDHVKTVVRQKRGVELQEEVLIWRFE